MTSLLPTSFPSRGGDRPRPLDRSTLQTGMAEREGQAKVTVLLVDDFEPVRVLMGRYLDRLGFRMLTAPDAAHAIRTLDQERVDHVLLDVNLPGGSRAVYDHIRLTQNGLHERTVFITGGFVDGDSEAFVRETGRPALFKPFNLGDLKDLLRG